MEARGRERLEPGVKETWIGGAVRAWEEGGAPLVAMRSLNHLAAHRIKFGSVTFFRRDLVEDPPESAAGMDITIYRAASLMDAPLVLQGCDPARPPAVVLERLRRGDVCFLAVDVAGRAVHSDWATTVRGHVPELEMDVLPQRGEVYLYDAFSPPEVRGRRLFGVVLDSMFRSLRAAGFSTAYSYVRGDQPVGIVSAHKRLRPVGTLWYARLAGRRPFVVGRRGPDMPCLVRSDDTDHKGGGDTFGAHPLVVDGAAPVQPVAALARAAGTQPCASGEPLR
jgi:hypothetical protein